MSFDDVTIEMVSWLLEQEYLAHPNRKGAIRLEGETDAWRLYIVSPGVGVFPKSWDELNGVRVLILHRSVAPAPRLSVVTPVDVPSTKGA